MRETMMGSLLRSLLAAFLLASLSGAASAAPAVIGYQGRLTDAAGQPLAGDVDLSFALFAGAAGGPALWSETQTGVAVHEGVFHVALGSATPLPPMLFASDVLWLEVTVDGETLTPRQRLLASPYALQSERTARPPSLEDLAGTPCNTESAYRGVLEIGISEPGGDVSIVCRPTGTFTLTIARTGDGEGRVVSTPPGIDCGADCSEDFAALTEVTLQATASPGSTLGTDLPPTVKVDGNRVLEVRFALPPTLTVKTSGPSRPSPCEGACLPYTGFVLALPPGAVCGSIGSRARNATCQYAFQAETRPLVTLTATPQADAVLLGFEGCDVVEGAQCQVAVQKGTLVRALFGPRAP